MLPDLIVTSLADAPKFLRQRDVRCIVSIGDPGEKKPRGFTQVPVRLRLEFGDLRDAHLGDGRVPPPEPDDVEQIVRFVDAIVGTRTLIHCQQGISRSTAAAFIVTAKLLGPGRELEALDHVVKLRPIALPNTRMVRFADAILGRAGAMSRALLERKLVIPGLD